MCFPLLKSIFQFNDTTAYPVTRVGGSIYQFKCSSRY
nr:MAG TPA: hypothetical protein [Caudoviricetes sp.]